MALPRSELLTTTIALLAAKHKAAGVLVTFSEENISRNFFQTVLSLYPKLAHNDIQYSSAKNIIDLITFYVDIQHNFDVDQIIDLISDRLNHKKEIIEPFVMVFVIGYSVTCDDKFYRICSVCSDRHSISKMLCRASEQDIITKSSSRMPVAKKL